MSTPPSHATPEEPAEGLPRPPVARADTAGLDIVPRSLPAPTSDVPAARPPRRTMLTVVILAGMALLGAVATGAFLLVRGSSGDLMRLVPADAEFVVVAQLDPSASQKVNLLRLRDAVPSLATSTAFDARLRPILDDRLAWTGLRGDDVLGWLGNEIGMIADVEEGDLAVAGLFHVGDRDGAQTMLAKLATPGSPWDGLEWREREIAGSVLRVAETPIGGTVGYAYAGDVLVIADDEALLTRIVETGVGARPSMLGTSAFLEAEAELPSDRLLLAYANPGPFFDEGVLGLEGAALGMPQLLGIGDLEAVRGVAMTVAAEPEGFVVDVAVRYYTARLYGPLRERLAAADTENEILVNVPGDAWGVYATQRVDVALRSFDEALRLTDPQIAEDLDRAGLGGTAGFFAHTTGEAAVAFMGDDPSGAVLVAAVDDDASTRQVLDDALRRLVSPSTGTLGLRHEPDPEVDRVRWRSQEYEGTVVTWANRGDPPVAFAVHEGVAVIGASRGRVVRVLEAGSGGSRLIDDGRFQRVLPRLSVSDGVLYVDPRAMTGVIRGILGRDALAAFDEEVAPDLRAVRTAAGGLEADDRGQHLRLLITVG